VGRRFKREGTYGYLWLIHVDVWQKPVQYCKDIILQLKIKKKKKVLAGLISSRTSEGEFSSWLSAPFW